jgi:hypothetical protein
VIKTAAEKVFAERQKQKEKAKNAEGDDTEATDAPATDQLLSTALEPARKKSRTGKETLPSGSHSRSVQQSSGTLRHVSTVRNDTLAIPPTQQTFTFEKTFQSSHQ